MPITERIPPHNDDAERSVLGAAMLSRDALFDVLEEVRRIFTIRSTRKYLRPSPIYTEETRPWIRLRSPRS